MSRLSQRRRILTIDAAHPAGIGRRDTLAVEEPLEIRLGGVPYTVTMRTPGHDVELAHGLLASEGIIRGTQDLLTARYCSGSVMDEVNTYNVLDVGLAPGVRLPTERLRSLVTTSACGVCGTASIDQLRQEQAFDLREDDVRIDPRVLLSLPTTLRAAQATFETTGGLHASALFDAGGALLVAREDVGRHNATDKVVGWAMQHGRRPAAGCVLMVSGRTSFELAQKAALAGIPVLAGVSAPSSLAVDVAEATGLTLAGFMREDRMNVYAGAHRIVD